MGKSSKQASGAIGQGNLLFFAPEQLVVVKDKNHPLYDKRGEEPPDEAMVLSIMAHGIKVPVSLRHNGYRDQAQSDPIIEVVAGRRRVTAAIEANKRLKAAGGEAVRVPAVMVRGDQSSLIGTLIMENELRKEDTPLQRAEKLQRYLNTGRTVDEAAIVFGVTKPTIANYLKVLELHPKVQKALENNNLPFNVVKELSVMPQEEQPAALEKLVEAGATKGAKGVEAARNVRNGKTAEASKTLRMMAKPTIQQWANKLKKAEGKDAEIAYAVLSRILGHERALSNQPRVREALEHVLSKD